jgi:hypothetical protein
VPQRRFWRGLLSSIVILGCHSPTPTTGVAPRTNSGLCRTLDPDGAELRQKLVRVATSLDSVPVKMRAMVGLPRLTANSVTFVTDAAACGRAAESFGGCRAASPGYQTVYLFRMGSTYVVHRPDGHAGVIAVVMDPQFRILGMWGL